jgi:hypothetical protein
MSRTVLLGPVLRKVSPWLSRADTCRERRHWPALSFEPRFNLGEPKAQPSSDPEPREPAGLELILNPGGREAE